MSEEARWIGEAARGILRDVTVDDPWSAVRRGGWVGIGVPEQSGGQGGGLAEAAALAEAAGATAAPAPVIEAAMAAMMLANSADTRGLLAALADGSERATLVTEVVHSDRSGCVADPDLVVPFGRHATLVVLVAALVEGGIGLAAVPTELLELVPGESLAGDPLDTLRLPSAQLPVPVSTLELPLQELIDIAAVLTAARICGALREVAGLTLEYAQQRSQFGRPIGTFQALSHDLARQEAQVAQVEAAVANALEGSRASGPGRAEAARVVASLAIDPVIKIAHQVHGAIGTTAEHHLHRYTLRLSSWRSAWGTAAWWSQRLGERTLADERWRDQITPARIL
jgi:acyl-CoA dehydrogenase